MKRKEVLAILILLVGVTGATPIVYFDTADPFVTAGETISINIFSTLPTDHIRMDRISDDGGGAAGNLWINPNYNPPLNSGTLVNENGILIEGVSSGMAVISPTVTGILYSFDYTVSEDVISDQIVTIFADFSGEAINQVYVNESGWHYVAPESLSLTVVPEPATILLLGMGGVLVRRKIR